MQTDAEKEEYSRRKRCDGKTAHRYKLCADIAVQLSYESGERIPKGMVMEAYQCNFCNCWHIGKAKIKRLKR